MNSCDSSTLPLKPEDSMWPKTACILPKNLNRLLQQPTQLSSEFDSLKSDIKELIESSISNGLDKMKALILEREHVVYDKFRDIEVEQSSLKEHIGQKDREIQKIFMILDSMRADEKVQSSRLQDVVSTLETKYKMWNMIIAAIGVVAALAVYFVK